MKTKRKCKSKYKPQQGNQRVKIRLYFPKSKRKGKRIIWEKIRTFTLGNKPEIFIKPAHEEEINIRTDTKYSKAFLNLKTKQTNKQTWKEHLT